jgi:sterol desaturase/sphingolipid hydroxylase (fatty acid hydroxylase superfamily)
VVRAVLAGSSWWLVMGGFLLATWWLSDGGRPGPELVGALTIANSVFLVAAEQLLPRERGANLLRDRQSLNDLAHGVLFQYAGRPAAQALGAAGITWASAHGSGLAWPGGLPFPVQVVLGILLWSLLGYGFHRALHRLDVLWWFHALHHDTRQMHLLKSGRLHVGEEFLQYLVVPVPVLLLGVGPEVMAWVALWNVFDGNLVHSNLDQRFPRVLHYVMPTVQNHTLHHAEPRRLQDSNYGSFPFWDVLFGTYNHPDRNPVPATGIAGDPVPRGFLGQLLYPFRALLASRAGARDSLPEAG